MPVELKKWPKNWQKSLPDEDDPSLVCQNDWGFLIPSVHRALANPAETVVFPKLRYDGSDPVLRPAFRATNRPALAATIGG